MACWTLLLAATVFLFCGCASTPVTTPATAMAPTPYTAEQIRAATQAGRSFVFETTAADGGKSTRRTTFVAVDDEGADMRSGGGADAAGEVHRTTWDELMKHAAFPAAATKISEGGLVEVPAGKFDTTLYEVSTPTSVTRFWFAKDLPGPPVRFEAEVQGKVAESNVLIEHTPGGR